MFDPAKRIVPQQYIAHGASAYRGNGSNDNDAEQIHFTATCGKRTCHRLGGDPNNIKNSK